MINVFIGQAYYILNAVLWDLPALGSIFAQILTYYNAGDYVFWKSIM
jgi:hypothetical protein